MFKNSYVCDGNEAAADIAYRLSDLAVIYPITPSSTMAEIFETFSSKQRKNIFGNTANVTIMQSEAGAIGAVHGALQIGAQVSTFTASQGLLLMIPNMYKIAGEGHQFVMHVAARAVATHALSIFGDHSDIMTVRETGFAILGSNNVQESHDMALVAHLSTLKAKVPFLHYFDGFRTSHEITSIEQISDETILSLLDKKLIKEKRDNGLTPEKPCIRGTAQNPDVFFQGREAQNPTYNNVISIVEDVLNEFGNKTGRYYDTVEYYGNKDAENIIVSMGSSCDIIEETIDQENKKGAKLGLIKIRLYRPFPVAKFSKLLPSNVKKIAVLDRTKEPGSVGEPLFLDVVAALKRNKLEGIEVIGGRYGLGSKEFTPYHVKQIFEELSKPNPKKEFVVGINDDVTKLSLDDLKYDFKDDAYKAMFFGLGSDGTVGASKNSADIININTGKYVQNYSVYDSKKSGGFTCSHLRIKDTQIKSPYLVENADFTSVSHFPMFFKQDVLANAKEGGILLINSPYEADTLWDQIPQEVQKQILDKNLTIYIIDAGRLARDLGLGFRTNTIMQTCFFYLSKLADFEKISDYIKRSVKKTYGKKGEKIIEMNIAAIDKAVENLYRFDHPKAVSKKAPLMSDNVPLSAPDFVKNVISQMIKGKGDDLPVSAFSDTNGQFPSGTTKYEKRSIASQVPCWNLESCIQCGKCSLVCPHASIRSKVLTKEQLENAPDNFKSADYKTPELGQGYNYAITISPHDCTGCGLCVENCPMKTKEIPALVMEDIQNNLEQKERAFEYCASLPDIDKSLLNMNITKHNQLVTPLFEFSGSCAGCGQTPYVKLLTQLFGDRMLISNATGCSSIYGGNLPTTPYTKNSDGRGPAWSNSLFEDNAEYGFGMRLALDKNTETAVILLKDLKDELGLDFINQIINNKQSNDVEIKEQRALVKELNAKLKNIKSEKAKELSELTQSLIKKSLWIMGGDGWAYDIGYGGLDHILYSDKNVNIFVLDTEVYSNTGGQQSKSTPIGAAAKFASTGKVLPKKDLGLLAMASGNVYVARIALGANEAQAVKAIREAEAHNGPSLIIAYAPCVLHGIDMKFQLNQQKEAVKTGHWPLYRYDPKLYVRKGVSPLQLDSQLGDGELASYVEKENRYGIVKRLDEKHYNRLIRSAKRNIKYRNTIYSSISKFKNEV